MASDDQVRATPQWLEKRSRRRRWIKLILLLLPLVGVVGYWMWGAIAERRLDALVAEYRSRGEPMTAEDFRDAPVPDEQNAVVALRRAAALLNTQIAEWRVLGLPGFRPPLREDEQAAVTAGLEANREALEAIAEAAAYQAIDWGAASDPSTFVLTVAGEPLDSQARSLAHLLGAAAIEAQARGDDRAAIVYVRQMLFVGRVMHRRPTLISHLVACGIDAMAAGTVALIAPGLRAGGDAGEATIAEVRGLMAELLDESSLRDGGVRALRGERYMQLQVARSAAAGVADPLSGGAIPPLIRGAVLRPLVLNDARLMMDYMSGLIEATAAEDRAAFSRRAPAVPPEVDNRPILHLLSSMLLPSAETAQAQYRIMAQRRLAATALAIRLYSLEHDGRRPGELAELVPALLAKVPADPLATDGAPLRYVNDPKRPRVYSVGDDGVDDGGDDTERRLPLSMRGPMDMVFDLVLQPRPVEEE